MMARTVADTRFVARDFGTALRLDGVDDRVTVAGITPSTTNFSLGIWVYWLGGPVLSSSKNLASWTDANGGFAITHLSANTGKVRFEVKNGAAAVAQVDSLLALNVGWNHVVTTYAVDSAKLYINGVLQNTDTSCTMTAASQTFTIGRSSSGVQPFIGTIDQFIFRNGAPWTQSEITDLYRAGVIPSGSTCILQFDEGSGTTANDSSGNGNNGTILGGGAYTASVPCKARATAGARATATGRTLA